MAKKVKWQKQFPLVFDLKTIVILIFIVVWAIITIVDTFNSHYDVPESINLILGGIIAYFTASKLREK